MQMSLAPNQGPASCCETPRGGVLGEYEMKARIIAGVILAIIVIGVMIGNYYLLSYIGIVNYFILTGVLTFLIVGAFLLIARHNAAESQRYNKVMAEQHDDLQEALRILSERP